MASYIATTPAERAEMLAALGKRELLELFADVPVQALQQDPLDLPTGRSESEVLREMQQKARQNRVFASVFRGAGSYRHYIPAIVSQVISKESFLSAYTPYQAEISQGILQAIFEYQTMIAELTGLDAANASVYDGAWAAAEAVGMCCERRRGKALLSAGANPQHRKVIETYCDATGMELVEIPLKDGCIDAAALRGALDDSVCALYLQQPNFYGQIEDAASLAALVHEAGAKLILGIHPIAAAVLPSPGECGADIAVGDGQPLGLPMSFGGPSVGFMACTKALIRKLPGRIVGQTVDGEGRRAFVLTLQAREQHIRREKASSNICSNQALCAMAVGAYLTAMGPDGLRRAAQSCMAHADYLKAQLLSIPGFTAPFPGPIFDEFVTSCPIPVDRLMDALERRGILGGLPLEGALSGHILWCATELNDQADIDALIAAIREEVIS